MAVNQTFSPDLLEQEHHPPEHKIWGVSLIELIVIVSILAGLTSMASSAIRKSAHDFENDEIQAHLNSLAADCQKTYTNLADSITATPTPASVDTSLLSKNDYEKNSDNTCKYFQVNPKNSKSKTHYSMGFGSYDSKVTQFAINDLPIPGLQLS